MSKFQIIKGITDNLEETPYIEGQVYFTYNDLDAIDLSIYADIDGVRRKIDCADKATMSDVSSAIAAAIGNINQFNVAIVPTLPDNNIDTHTIYFMSNGNSGDSIYDEWMYINNNWEKIGTTTLDLSNYLQTTDIADWAKAKSKPTYTANEVGALPADTVIPTKISDLTNDSDFITDAGVTSFNGSTGAITYTAPVTSVNGQTGIVNLTIPAETTVTQTLTSGTAIGKVNNTTLYAPNSYDDTALAARVTALENIPWVTYYSGTTEPANSFGENGDIYLQTE